MCFFAPLILYLENSFRVIQNFDIMPFISKKGYAMPESPIRKLVPYAERAIEAGKKCNSPQHRTTGH